MMITKPVSVFEALDLGLIDFKKALEAQKEAYSRVKNGEQFCALIFCRHHPVITLGRSSSRKNILATEADLISGGIEVCETERGGDVTYHGPGSMNVYPIINLKFFKKDIHWFLRTLEEIVINLLSDLRIKGLRLTGLTGVWTGIAGEEKKIASIGITIRHWITLHGLSIIIKEADLKKFQYIRPCGMDIKMTSLETLLGRNIEMEEIKEILIRKFEAEFTRHVNMVNS
ncbi:MAG: lipoyl(octanoyl) transferase LipB [Candidatus Omnitrophica bacterium]|nr:lipoyl(octanoyl) transferase LipB [Candidatus Omnitrophota bacterium]